MNPPLVIKATFEIDQVELSSSFDAKRYLDGLKINWTHEVES